MQKALLNAKKHGDLEKSDLQPGKIDAFIFSRWERSNEHEVG